jgi:SYP7 family syntaxin
MSREIDGLLEKLAKINVEMGGEDTRSKDKKGNNMDRFGELRIKISEKLHALKIVRVFVKADILMLMF